MSDFDQTVADAVGEPQAATVIDRIEREPIAPDHAEDVFQYVGKLLAEGTIDADEVVAESADGQVVRVGNLCYLREGASIERIGFEAARVAHVLSENEDENEDQDEDQLDASTADVADDHDRMRVYFDGACRGNPGPAAVGYHIIDDADVVIRRDGEPIGETTNNQAEYKALIAALRAASNAGADEVDVRGDSELVVRQISHEYCTTDPGLRELRDQAQELLAEFDDWSLTHISREANQRADQEATAALNAALDEGDV